MHAERFGVDAIRERVLAAWTASPARFREDANAEEDLALGGYRDRLIVELAQNAVDAAARARQPGRLRLRVADGVLCAANTGAALDADGVQALATLRASAKRDQGTVGRFGVGFAAVLAVTDNPRIVSTSGCIEFDADRTRALVSAVPELGDELARRGGSVPALRLPFGCAGTPPDGFDTEVRLTLRAGAEQAVRRQLDELGPELLLSLPGLAEVDVEGRLLTRTDLAPGSVELTDGGRTRRWALSTASGDVPAGVLAGRPVEERERTTWSVCWAVPVDDGVVSPLSGRQVVHAPTPSDEPLSLPVRLIATFPLAPDRRHVAPGPLTDHLVASAASAYAELLCRLEPDPAVLALVPRPGLAGAELDAALSRAVLAELRETVWLPTAAGARVRPDRAVALDPVSEGLVAALLDVVPGLLPASWSARRNGPVLDAIGIDRLSVAAVVELLSTVDRPAAWWAAAYAALGELGSLDDPEALAALPVPLADGRTAYGARGLLLPDRMLPAAELSGLGLRLVDPAAVHPLLKRLGARPATAAAVLLDPVVRGAVEESLDEEDPAPIAGAVLALVRAAGATVEEFPWLADLALPDTGGGWSAAGELMVPGSPLGDVLADTSLGVVDPAAVQRWGAAALEAVGVLVTFALLRAEDVEVGDELDLDAADEWYDAVLDRLPPTDVPPILHTVLGVRDLERVRADGWPVALSLLARLPGEVFDPLLVGLSGGQSARLPSYTTWWLSTHPVLDGRRPDRLRRNGSDELSGLYDEAPDDTPNILVCPSTVDDVLADPESALDLLARLGDPRRAVSNAVLDGIYGRLAAALDGVDVSPPARVRTVAGAVVARDMAVVLDAPFLLPLLDRAVVPAGPAAVAVADLLDLPLASERVTAEVTSRPDQLTAWRDLPGAASAARRLRLSELPGRVAIHIKLTVDDRRVDWWANGDADHVSEDAGAAALGRVLAWRHGAWQLRAALAEAFARPEDATALAAEDSAG